MTTLFGNNLVRSLTLGFALGSAAMAITFAAESVQAAPVVAMAVAVASR